MHQHLGGENHWKADFARRHSWHVHVMSQGEGTRSQAALSLRCALKDLRFEAEPAHGLCELCEESCIQAIGAVYSQQLIEHLLSLSTLQWPLQTIHAPAGTVVRSDEGKEASCRDRTDISRQRR